MSIKRGEILKFSIAFALRKVKIYGRKGVITEAQRYEIAEYAVEALKHNGNDPWQLNEDMPRI